jgi:hypothetical protein
VSLDLQTSNLHQPQRQECCKTMSETCRFPHLAVVPYLMSLSWRCSMYWLMNLFCSVTIKVLIISSTVEHFIQSNLNPFFWAMVSHIWLRKKSVLISFKAEYLLDVDANITIFLNNWKGKLNFLNFVEVLSQCNVMNLTRFQKIYLFQWFVHNELP